VVEVIGVLVGKNGEFDRRLEMQRKERELVE
jgi:hypothetical protein